MIFRTRYVRNDSWWKRNFATKNVKIDIFTLILNNCIHTISRNIDWFKSTFRNFFSKNICNDFYSKILFVRNKRFEFELFEIWNRNFVIKNLKWNCLNSTKTLFFELIFSFEIDVIRIHIMNIIVCLHEIVCDDVWCKFLQNSSQKIRRCYVFCSLFIVYENFHYTMRNWFKIIRSFICCIVCKVNFCKINIFFVETIWISWNSNTILFVALTIRVVEMSTIQCILIDFLLILSNVNFLSFWFWMILYSCNFVIVQKVSIQIVVCFCWNQHVICFWKCYDILIFNVLNWKRNDRNRCFNIVFSNMIWM